MIRILETFQTQNTGIVNLLVPPTCQGLAPHIESNLLITSQEGIPLSSWPVGFFFCLFAIAH